MRLKKCGPKSEQKPEKKVEETEHSVFTSIGSMAEGGKQPPNSRHKELRLQTAWTQVRNPGDDRKSVMLRVILDNGSDRSYISKEMVAKLKAEPVAKDILSIHKLNQKKRPEDTESPVVAIELKLRNNSYLKIFANVLSPVVGHIRRYPVDMKKWGSFFPTDEKELADTVPEDKEWVTAELLIGGDYYEQIVQDGKTPIGDSGLFLRSSKLGAILTGATDSEGVREKEVGGYFCVAHRKEKIEYSVNVATYVTQEIPELQMFWTPDRTASLTPDLSQFSSLEG
ncbi:MAG: hypothetical protein GY696_40295, partial [Gammaproteobacteria bacterium]|nr:hypothetical protein [Gammaproteobacteria bacterium]